MAKVIHFPDKNKDQIEILEHILSEVKKGNIKSFAFAAELQGEDEGVVATAYHNADVGTKQLLASHIQIDIVAAVVEVNFFEE